MILVCQKAYMLMLDEIIASKISWMGPVFPESYLTLISVGHELCGFTTKNV